MKQILELILIFMAFFLPGFIWQSQSFNQEALYLTDYMLQFILIAVPQTLLIAYILKIQKEPPLSEFGIVKPAFKDLFYSLLICAGIFSFLLPMGLLYSLLPEKGKNFFATGFRWELANPKQIPLVFFFSLVTGYREELFFRSYLLTRLSKISGNAFIGLLLSSLLFSCGHIYQGPAGFFIALIQGFYFGVIFLKTRNLHRLALAHAFYNSTILFLTLFSKYSLPG